MNQTTEGIEERDARMRKTLAAFSGTLLAIGTAESAIQLSMLFYLSDPEHTERRTVRHIAHHFGTSKARITRNADTLENLGYIKRHDDPADKRSVIFKIAPAGTRFLKHVTGAASKAFMNNA